MRYFWPEFEVNYTWWPDGAREGDSQVFLTPGLMIGSIPIYQRIGIAVGGGYEIAVTSHPAYNHAVVLSAACRFE